VCARADDLPSEESAPNVSGSVFRATLIVSKRYDSKRMNTAVMTIR
jgi:hypothetical protein